MSKLGQAASDKELWVPDTKNERTFSEIGCSRQAQDKA
jgi:hypothetical protein